MTATTSTKLGFVGLGHMGGNMAARLLAAGYEVGSPMLKLRAPLVLDLPQEAWFDVGLMHKDIRLALAVARDLGIQLPSTGVADQMLTRAAQLGYEHRDIAALFQVLAHTSDSAPDRD